jgi:electron transfer flavoprotein beta subunit
MLVFVSDARAILVKSDEEVEPLAVAKILREMILREEPTIVFLGKQAIDDDANQTGQMTAALLDWPQATSASRVEILGNEVRVTREVDNGLQVVELTMPTIITADLRLNEPRYASLPNIMKARKKPLLEIPVGDLNVDIRRKISVLSVEEPMSRVPGIRLKTVDELADRLRSEARNS